MKKNDVVIIVVVLLSVVGLVLILQSILNRDTKYNWAETYSSNSDQPYGTMVITDLLKRYFPTKDFDIEAKDINAQLIENDGKHKNYIFIGEFPYYTDSTINLLKDFVDAGNDVFIATKSIPEQLSKDIILQKTNNISFYDTVYYQNDVGDSNFYMQQSYAEDPTALSWFSYNIMTMNFKNSAFRTKEGYTFAPLVGTRPFTYEWNYFHPDYLNRIKDYTTIGTIQSQNFTDLIEIPMGNGHFYIHLNPIVFTNYFQIQSSKLTYTSKIFSYLKPGDIIYDNFSQSYYNDNQANNDQQEEGPLKYILGNQSLRWAWYTLLTGLALFLIFRTKRIQQPIAILEPNENKSLEFVQTIGRMYFMRKNNKQLAAQKIKLFLHFITDRYNIPTQPIDDTFYQKLKLKSEVDEDSVKKIFKHYKYINNTNDVTNDDLIELHTLMNYFYKHCK